MEPWPSVGFDQLDRDARGGLVPGEAWWRRQLARPELALVDESCGAERALHAALVAAPLRAVGTAELARLADPDARENWQAFLRWRDRVQAAGSIDAAYVGLFGGAPVDLAPVFVDQMAQVIVRALLQDIEEHDATADARHDAVLWRTAELLFRPQRCATVDGRLVAGDRDTLDALNRDGGLGALGRMLVEAGAPLRAAALEVLSADHAAAYFAQAERRRFLLDLGGEVERDLGHGLRFALAPTHSAPGRLARLLERWVARLLGVEVRIRPLARIDDPAWRWHVGLDAAATDLLNDLYAGREVDDERRRRIVALFRLDFVDPADARPELAGVPVWLGAATDADGLLRLKPQNLLTNLPLAGRN